MIQMEIDISHVLLCLEISILVYCEAQLVPLTLIHYTRTTFFIEKYLDFRDFCSSRTLQKQFMKELQSDHFIHIKASSFRLPYIVTHNARDESLRHT